MSYILDALRRADAERERGAVPGLHTQQFGVLPDDEDSPRRPRLLIAAVVALALALIAVLAWNFFAASEPPAKPVVQAQVAPAPVVVAPPPVALPPSSLASAPAAMSAPPPAAVRRPPPPRPPLRREPAAAAQGPPGTAGTTTGAAPAAPGDRIYSFTELPDAIRRELPKLTYGGGSYGADKASRFAFLNGQVFHEGDTIAPGLVLRQVKQKGVILGYKGYRFELGA